MKNRKDGKYIKPEDGMHAIMPYLMDKRTEAEVSKTDILDITELKNWVDSKQDALDFKYTYFQALAAVFAKTIYNRPLLNRFVQGFRIYERKYVSLTFIAKDKLNDNAEERIIVLKVNPKENALDLAHRMAIDVFNTREKGTNDIDDFLKVLTKIPRWLLRPIVRFIKWLDFHGWVPSALCDDDSNYATLLLSNLGSIKCNSCYHHLNNYGTNSIVITIGIIREENKRWIVDITSTLDERIADGFYFAKSIKLAQHILDNPKLLEEALETKVDYEF